MSTNIMAWLLAADLPNGLYVVALLEAYDQCDETRRASGGGE